LGSFSLDERSLLAVGFWESATTLVADGDWNDSLRIVFLRGQCISAHGTLPTQLQSMSEADICESGIFILWSPYYNLKSACDEFRTQKNTWVLFLPYTNLKKMSK
jgi:hypothetical protein